MIMNTSAVYLQLRTCISLSSNCQTFVSNSLGHSYCWLLLLDAINFVNITTQTRAGLLCIWWTQSRYQLCRVHLANDFKLTHRAKLPFTHDARHSGRDEVNSKSVCSVWCSCGTCLCFLPARSTQISTPLWFLCIIVWQIHVTRLLLCLSSPDTELTIAFVVTLFKLLTSSDSDVN
jgi:hypothetical protein